MRKSLILAAAIGVLSFGPAAATEYVTPPAVPHPLPQGVPTLVSPAVVQPVINLSYGILNGHRVLYEPQTGRVVYVLLP